MSDDERDYLAEAIEIIDGGSMMMAQAEHLKALWNMLTRRQHEIIRNEAVREEPR